MIKQPKFNAICRFILLVVLLISGSILFTESSKANTDLSQLNRYIDEVYGVKNYYNQKNRNSLTFNNSIYTKYSVVTYGEPIGGKYSNITNQFEPRYLGESVSGEHFPNYDYAYDLKSNVYFDDMNWIINPSDNPLVTKDPRYSWITSTKFNVFRTTPIILDAFKAGMHLQHGNANRPSGDWFRGDEVNAQGKPIEWARYMHIIEPPTEETHGSAMLWHISQLDGKLYYIDVRLTRFKDLAATVYVKHRTLQGQSLSQYDYTARVANYTSHLFEATSVPQLDYKGFSIANGLSSGGLQASSNAYQLDYVYAHDRQTYTITFFYDAVQVKPPILDGNRGQIVIKSSDQRFDVQSAIPTGELIDIEATVQDPFIFDYNLSAQRGSAAYHVIVRKPFRLSWMEQVGVDKKGVPIYERRSYSDVFVGHYTLERPYAYWSLDHLYAYDLSQVGVNNAKLNGNGGLSLVANQLGYKGNTVHYIKHANHLQAPVPLMSQAHFDASADAFVIDLEKTTYYQDYTPDFDYQDLAQRALGPVQVRNDHLSLNGRILVSDSWQSSSAPTPLPKPSLMNSAVLTLKNYRLPHTSTNGPSPTSGQIMYTELARLGQGPLPRSYAISGNSMRVHTPVVCQTQWPQLSHLDQRGPSLRTATGNWPNLPLNTAFDVQIKTDGHHIGAKGYGQRNYKAYLYKKRMAFPFDVYAKSASSGKFEFYKAQTWIEVAADDETLTLKIPTWVVPGSYTVLSQAIAKNYRALARHQEGANLDLQFDIASQQQQVSVSGLLYGFTIGGSEDLRWKPSFSRYSDLRFSSSGSSNLPTLSLPIMGSKQPQPLHYPRELALGYPLYFEISTAGSYASKDVQVMLIPSYYLLDRSGQRIEVDLYQRHANTLLMAKDQKAPPLINTSLQGGLYKPTTTQIEATANAYNDLIGQYGIRGSEFVEASLRPSPVATAGLVQLNWSRRILTGPGSSKENGHESIQGSDAGSSAQALASVQKWYGSFVVPNSTLVAPRGKKAPLISRGLLTVNFRIVLMDTTNQSILLEYAQNAPYANGWLNEGYGQGLYEGLSIQSGDIAIFELEHRASKDLELGL